MKDSECRLLSDKAAQYLAKGLATIGAGIACGAAGWAPKGEHGVGWFIIALMLIW